VSTIFSESKLRYIGTVCQKQSNFLMRPQRIPSGRNPAHESFAVWCGTIILYYPCAGSQKLGQLPNP
jgi:hypothetical protein